MCVCMNLAQEAEPCAVRVFAQLPPIPEDAEVDGDDGDFGDDDAARAADGQVANEDGGDACPRRGRRDQVTPREFHAHRLQVRERFDEDGEVLCDDEGTPMRDDALHRAGRLLTAHGCAYA